MSSTPTDPKKKSSKSSGSYSVLRYSGMAFEMVILMLIAIWIGGWLDEKLDLEQPIMTIVLVLLAAGGFLYRLVKNVSSGS